MTPGIRIVLLAYQEVTTVIGIDGIDGYLEVPVMSRHPQVQSLLQEMASRSP